MLIGVDVSHHQNPDSIDWGALAGHGVRFVYVRATYGVSRDQAFLSHANNARAAGLLVGAYHFLRFKSSQPAVSQAEAFLEAIAPLAPHSQALLPPMLDLEDNHRYDDSIRTAADRKSFIRSAKTWLREVERTLGRLAGIYTSASFFDGTLQTPPGFDARPLWVAHYTTAPSPNLPESWRHHHFWQFTERGEVPGYRGPLDLNRFEGDEDDLRDLASSQDLQVRQADISPVREQVSEPLAVSGDTARRVAARGLNLRSEPRAADHTYVVTLPLGHQVEVLDAATGPWVRVRTFVNDTEQIGYCHSDYLRPLERDAVERLVSSAVDQWLRFRKGAGKEHVDPYFRYVGEMWKALGEDHDGRDQHMYWSAAAISYFVGRAGPGYEDFRANSMHSVYIHDAISKREAGDPAPFWGYRLDEQKAEVGDIVCMWRTRKTDFDTARTHQYFPSHTDVIVGIHHGMAVTLGGNVSNSVSTKEFALDARGRLKPAATRFGRMKNKVGGGAAGAPGTPARSARRSLTPPTVPQLFLRPRPPSATLDCG